MKNLLGTLLCLFLLAPAFAQDSTKNNPLIIKDKNFDNPTFPFIRSLTSQEYDITVNLNDPKVAGKYEAIFKKNNQPYTADGWEDIIIAILQNKNPALAHQVITSAQDNVLRIGTGEQAFQKEFLSYVVPVFMDVNELEKWLE